MAPTDQSPAPDAGLTVQRTAQGELAKGTLGVAHLVFMVMAAVAPAAGAVALLPLAIALGVNVGTPGMFVAVAIILLLFAVGFTRMVPHVRNAGAFYAFITQGLGRTFGLPAAYIALTAYLSIGTATVGSLGFFANITLSQFFGVHVAWWVCSVVAMVLVGLLGYYRITASARVLGTALIAEGIVVLVMDIGVLAHRGFGSYPLESFSPHAVLLSGAVGVGVIYAFSCFQGFEGTAIYAEEARSPDRTVPRATYAAIVCVCLFFVLTSWSMIAGAGGAKAGATALADPGNFAYHLSDTYVATGWTDVLEVLIVTSCFAGTLAFHNAASRYFYALARDGFMPGPLARTHPRFKSPTIASVTSFAIITVVMLAFAVAGLDPLTNLATSLTGVGAVGVLGLVTFTSLAVVVFFLRKRRFGWRYTVAPALGTLGVGTALVLALADYPSITGTSSQVINSLPWLLVVVIAVAVGAALWARYRVPERYERMGQTRIED